MLEQIVFWVTAVVSLTTAIFVVSARNAVHSALGLVLNFFTLAVFYVLLEAEFLAATQVIVYAGAIMVLFLFVIMLLGVDRPEELVEKIRFQRWAAGLFGVALFALVIFSVRTAFETTPFAGLERANEGGNVEGLGRLLFTRYLWPFEVTSLLLIVAAVGAMVIGRRRRPEEVGEEEDES